MTVRDFVLQAGLFAIAAAACMLVSVIAGRLRPSLKVHLPPQRLHDVEWGGGSVLAAFLLLFVVPIFFERFILGSPDGQPAVAREERRIVYSVFWLCIQLVVVVAYMFPHESRRQFDDKARAFNSLALGVVTWMLAAPATLAVHAAARWATQALDGQPLTEHALLRLLRENQSDALLWQLVSVAAVICAPIREELFFRGILQPWIIRQPMGGEWAFAMAAVCGLNFLPADASVRLMALPVAFVAITYLTLLGFERWPVRVIRSLWVARVFPPIAHGSLPAVQVRRGVVGVAVLFGMFHASSWPDPIPLTILGLALGWLAFRTQSVLGPIVCHALFNGFILAQLRLDVWLKN